MGALLSGPCRLSSPQERPTEAARQRGGRPGRPPGDGAASFPPCSLPGCSSAHARHPQPDYISQRPPPRRAPAAAQCARGPGGGAAEGLSRRSVQSGGGRGRFLFVSVRAEERPWRRRRRGDPGPAGGAGAEPARRRPPTSWRSSGTGSSAAAA